MQNRILLVSSNDELTELVNKVSKELKIDLDIYEGGIMKDGHLYAQKNSDNYDVIISSGGTAEAIRQIVSKPVVSVEINVADILYSVFSAKKFNNKIGIVVYKNDELAQLYKLKNHLDIDCEIFEYETKIDLIEKLDDAVSIGKLTLVGIGGCIKDTAQNYALDYIIIKCSEKNVRKALINAINICELSRSDKERAKRYQTILDCSEEGIISFDKGNKITSINATAKKILDIKSEAAIDSDKDFISNESLNMLFGDGNELYNKLMKINDKQVLVNRIPIIIDNDTLGIVVNFQEISNIQKIERNLRAELYRKGLIAKYTFSDIIGDSHIIKETINKAKKIGRKNSTIMIIGETGTGKELFAQSIHNISDRREGPFVAVNCAALPENLLESELFGYEEGAFTGAKKGGKIGMFELAHNGTIFLDEISEIPLSLQGRLLRVLQERKILRVGGDSVVDVDIRIIVATNKNLYGKVMEGKFREDLFFRINVLDLYIPLLRERKQDIPLLFDNCFKKLGTRIKVKSLNRDVVNWIMSYNWPGNVRELENFAHKMIILLEDNDNIDVDSLGMITDRNLLSSPGQKYSQNCSDNLIQIEIGNIKDMENKIIIEAIKKFKGDKSMLADRLGISRTTLWKKLKGMDI
ncbi:MAG TPA: sigma 54-interacting transcriptional regulator [Clostridia bacterium]|nr:sigma 54-interacting transcriptional regulator [Clostridia bacterium]